MRGVKKLFTDEPQAGLTHLSRLSYNDPTILDFRF